MKRILFAAATALLLFGCAHREADYAPAYGYGNAMSLYGDCVYPDPCGFGYPYLDGFYPAPGVANLRIAIERSKLPSRPRTVTRPADGGSNRTAPTVAQSHRQVDHSSGGHSGFAATHSVGHTASPHR